MINEKVKNSLEDVIKRYQNGAIIMMELPSDSYFEANTASISLLLSKGFEGVYISFHRPFKNISTLLNKKGIDINKLLFIDIATAFSKETKEKNPRCIYISPEIVIDELVRAIYTSLEKLKTQKKFVFIDSLTTITLYKPLSEIMRFSEFVIRTVSKHEAQNVTLIFNVAQELAQKNFIKDIAMRVDKVIKVTE